MLGPPSRKSSPLPPRENVPAVTAVDPEVVPGAALDDVVTVVAAQDVVSVVSKYLIIATLTHDDIGSFGSLEYVVTAGALDRPFVAATGGTLGKFRPERDLQCLVGIERDLVMHAGPGDTIHPVVELNQ